MNIYKVLNEITEYIDNHLEEKIDYDVLARMMGVNSYTMQRIFSLLANITLSDYIRKRRLSIAGYDLYQKKRKVMDLAIKYQYESATAFSRAFISFHGVKPSQINKSTKLKNFPRIIFPEEFNITMDMEYQIREQKELVLYGIGIKTDNASIEKDAPKFFKKIESKYLTCHGPISYGMISYEEKERVHCNQYSVLYLKPIEGFEKIIIPKSKWLVFPIPSQEAKDIQKVSQKFYLEFLPSCRYSLREIPELEYYHDGVTEFLVPIY